MKCSENTHCENCDFLVVRYGKCTKKNNYVTKPTGLLSVRNSPSIKKTNVLEVKDG